MEGARLPALTSGVEVAWGMAASLKPAGASGLEEQLLLPSLRSQTHGGRRVLMSVPGQTGGGGLPGGGLPAHSPQEDSAVSAATVAVPPWETL